MFQRRYLVVAVGVWFAMLAWLMISGRAMLVPETTGRPHDFEMILLAIGMFPIAFFKALMEEFIFRFFPVFVIVATTYYLFLSDIAGNSWIELRPCANKRALYVRLSVYGVFATFLFAIAHRGAFIERLALQGVLGLIMYIGFLLAIGGRFDLKSLAKSTVVISFAHALYNTTVDAIAGARLI